MHRHLADYLLKRTPSFVGKKETINLHACLVCSKAVCSELQIYLTVREAHRSQAEWC